MASAPGFGSSRTVQHLQHDQRRLLLVSTKAHRPGPHSSASNAGLIGIIPVSSGASINRQVLPGKRG